MGYLLAIGVVILFVWLSDVYPPGFDPRKPNYIPPGDFTT